MAGVPPATLRLKIDQDALTANWRALDALSGPARAGAAVKANCYGLGIDRCLPTLREAGARDFFVAHWSEVPAVLEHVPAGQVSVLHGPLNSDDAAYARATGVRPVINSLHQAKVWRDSGGGPCDLMVDTGINRLGISATQLGDEAIQALEVHVLMSHLACADEDSGMNERQRTVFGAVRAQLAHKDASLANSAGIALGEPYALDLTRPGLSLYGGIPRPELADTIRQVAHPQAAIIQRRNIKAGETIGYNATFSAEHDITVGVVSLGYADGLLRCWQPGGALQHDGRKLAMLGKVSMDMIVVDLSSAPELREGDWLEVPYHLPDAARQTSLSQYELLTILGQRFD